jgi:hypothetical protein
MWQDEILEEIHQIREEHAKSFDYNFQDIFADWKRRQAVNGRELVSLQPKNLSNDALDATSQK